MEKHFCVIYTSSANEAFTLEQATYISDQRKRFCIEHHVSGLLVYGSGNFLRLIQGEQQNVLKVYETEKTDAPQFDVIKIFEGYTHTQYFEGYPLLIRILGTKELKSLDDFQSLETKEFLEECLNSDEMPMKILREFIKNNK